MERLDVDRCRSLLDLPDGRTLTDEEVIELRDVLYVLGGVVVDAYASLGEIDQTLFEPAPELIHRGIGEE